MAKQNIIIGSHSHLSDCEPFFLENMVSDARYTVFWTYSAIRGKRLWNSKWARKKKKRQRAEFEWVKEDKLDEIACWWHQGCSTAISDKQQEKKETFWQSQPPSASLFKTLLRNPHCWMSYFLFLQYEYNGKITDPRAEILKLGNSGMSENIMMNQTKRPRAMDLPPRGLEFSEVNLGITDSWTVFLGC